MVAHLVRLKLTLLGNTLRRSVWHTIGLVVATLYGLSLVFLGVGAAVVGGRADPVLTGQFVTLVGSVVVLGWWVVPLFAYGLDATLDPLRFTTYAIPRRQLVAGLAAAALVSVPALVTSLAALGVSFAWASDPVALVAALAGAVLGVGLCVVGARASTALCAPLLESRRYREVLMVVAVIPLLAIGPFFAWLSSRTAARGEVTVGPDELVPSALAPAARVLAWTPFGAPWSIPAAVHDGAWGLAGARVAVAAGTLALLAVIWDRALARALVSPRGGAAAGTARGLGWFGRLPATPMGAVAARCATYWLRDPRYATSLAVVPLLPVVLVVVGVSSGSGAGLLVLVVPVVAFVLGFAVSNDVGYDNTAFALHVATGVPGRADRWGRMLPVLALGVPLVAALSVTSAGVAGRWDLLPALLGGGLGVLGATLGTSSVASARLVYPVPRPGESPFRTPQGATVATLVAQMAAVAVIVALLLPTVGAGVAAAVTGAGAWWWATGVVGVATGGAAVVVGARWGARVYERRLPELLSQVKNFA
ncbi:MULTISPECIES: hypothetical protein [unclassified Isoptericola]|uniref:hypothetical protein n=1 Tax=unclassified Isoptericola TaxID=2623355 RepID=UPI0027138D77|nr:MULTISPECIES: hypothetical protein [unclassified Isoptericola]MDO8144285.1 hypothetical protein [Isoptericola sp. 178]MDO8151616.1 hypothetical protein [Isoptericola sp. b408]